jgi:signal transduction histidine kinase/ActR/RegA family two-component response regulator
VQLKRLDGSTFWASISAYGVKDGSGEIEAIDGIIRDISEIRELEEEILKRQRLESIGILAGGIAHDFNNILAAVLGNISLAKTYTNTTHPVYAKLDAAEKASVRASELTQQLLTFSRGGEPVKRLLHMERILKEASDFATRGSNVKCNVSVPESTWSVKADEGQIGQVISNLVINSMQAMPEGGIVELVVENQQLSAMNSMSLDAGNYVTISVIDHGRGILKENIDRIFDPYFTTKSEGSGLGLATVYSIVGRHGGQITVNSVEGDGSTFTNYLPASDQRNQQPIANTIEIARGTGVILVMDDEESVQAVIQEMLAQYGYKTVMALDGLTAVGLYKSAMDAGQKFDAVIMDLTIPGGMGGVESLSRIIKLDPDVRAIVSSGYSNDPVLANFTDYGFKACISKPFRLEKLLSTLQSALCS